MTGKSESRSDSVNMPLVLREAGYFSNAKNQAECESHPMKPQCIQHRDGLRSRPHIVDSEDVRAANRAGYEARDSAGIAGGRGDSEHVADDCFARNWEQNWPFIPLEFF